MLLLLYFCLSLQVFTISHNTIFISGTTNTKGITTTDASISSSRVSLSEGSQDTNASKSVFDNLHQDGIWFGRSRTSIFTRYIVRSRARKSLKNAHSWWPKAEVPYILQPSMRLEDQELVKQSFEEYHLYTCIRFRQANAGDADYLHIEDGPTCSIQYFHRGGRQNITFSRHCIKREKIIEYLGLSIGFIHQHRRPDRDEYVTIVFENILDKHRWYFEKFNANSVNVYGIPYDYLSIMHADEYAGSKLGETTIVTRNGSYQELIGKSTVLSFRDAKLANMMYGCSVVNGCKHLTCPGEGFVGQDCRCWCPSRNSNVTAEHCAVDAGGANMTCAQEGLNGQDCRRRNSFGNCNEANENVEADQTHMKLSIGHLTAIAIGSAVFLSAILAVFILAVHLRRIRRQETPCSQSPAAETEVVQNIGQATGYCSLDLQSPLGNYAVLNTEDPTYTSLQPGTDTVIYCQLSV